MITWDFEGEGSEESQRNVLQRNATLETRSTADETWQNPHPRGMYTNTRAFLIQRQNPLSYTAIFQSKSRLFERGTHMKQ
jgi:hypothetical protein